MVIVSIRLFLGTAWPGLRRALLIMIYQKEQEVKDRIDRSRRDQEGIYIWAGIRLATWVIERKEHDGQLTPILRTLGLRRGWSPVVTTVPVYGRLR